VVSGLSLDLNQCISLSLVSFLDDRNSKFLEARDSVGNLALKFACLSTKLSKDEQVTSKIHADHYLDLSPHDMFRYFYSQLNLEQRAALQFAFTETALLAILNTELEFDPEQRDLLFKKASLNSRSLFLANLRDSHQVDADSSSVFSQSLEHLTARIWHSTRNLYETELPPEREKELRAEMQECSRQMLSRLPMDQLELYAHTVSIRRFCFGLAAEAMFKCDASAALFGEQSSYTQAWKRKQIFRLMQAQRVS